MGTTIKKRAQLLHMLDDCRGGKIDLTIVKSVSRFARNQLDFTGIYIEDIKLNTLDKNSEFLLGVMSIVAQGESEQKVHQ